MSTWKNADITRKLMCRNEHSASKCELTLNETKDFHDLAITSCYIEKKNTCKTKYTWYPNMLKSLTCLQKKRQFTEIFPFEAYHRSEKLELTKQNVNQHSKVT